jgi:D-beta-D-heptose 7-phosphate kinase / D-beta-D-heptose 1-phosphate adenosyltransferase
LIDRPLEPTKRVRPAVPVKGADYTREEVVGGDVVEAAGGTVVLVDVVPGHSTTTAPLQAIGKPSSKRNIRADP